MSPQGLPHLGGITAPLLAAILVCVVSSMMMVFSPLLVDALRHSYGTDFERQIALIASADQTGMFLGAIIALATVPKFDRRRLALFGLGLLILNNLASIAAPELGAVLYVSRVLAGAGSGLAMGVAYAVFGASRVPERGFALFGLLQTAIGSASILYISTVIPRFGAAAVFGGSLLLAIIGLVAGIFIDAQHSVGTRTMYRPIGRRKLWTLGSLMTLSFFLLGVTATSLWANIQSIGISLGLTRTATSAAISFSLLGSVAGATVVLLTGNQARRTLATALISWVYLGGLALLLGTHSFVIFLVAVTAVQFGTNLGSHTFGAISEADSFGRLSIAYLLSLKAGFAAGPLAASLFIGDGFRSLVLAILTLSIIVSVLVALTLRVAHRCSTTVTDRDASLARELVTTTKQSIVR